MDITAIDLVAKHGISVFTVGAGTWLLFYLVKTTVVRLSKILDNLVEHINEFSANVRKDHSESDRNQMEMSKQHERFMQQHDEMMVQLREITTTLGRINGYKK